MSPLPVRSAIIRPGTRPSRSERSDAVVSIPLVQNIRQVRSAPQKALKRRLFNLSRRDPADLDGGSDHIIC